MLLSVLLEQKWKSVYIWLPLKEMPYTHTEKRKEAATNETTYEHMSVFFNQKYE